MPAVIRRTFKPGATGAPAGNALTFPPKWTQKNEPVGRATGGFNLARYAIRSTPWAIEPFQAIPSLRLCPTLIFRFVESMGRTVVIGDVHGCYEEFELLLERIDPRPGDRLIQLGDLVNRGPNSHRAVQIARQREIEVVMGNHELRLLKARKTANKSEIPEDDARNMGQLTEIDWRFLESLPAWIEDGEHGIVCVHGGFLPKQPWRKQSVDLVSRVQMIDADGQPQKRSNFPELPFWADLWHPPPFVVYGHTPRRHIYPRLGSLGIDTGCVYGGRLTAFILPERTVIQVDAFRPYARSRHI